MKQAERQQKAQIALIKTKLDLLAKNYSVFESQVDYWLPFDLIAYRDDKLYKIQVKYRADGTCSSTKSITDSRGCKTTTYKETDFNYYALYLPSVDRVVYPSIIFKDKKISTVVPNSGTHFYWYEDFLNFTDDAPKRTYKDFNAICHRNMLQQSESKNFTKQELEKMLWEMPTTEIAKRFNMTDNGIARWAKKWDLTKPPRGYWTNKAG